jgi:hypothetical protein
MTMPKRWMMLAGSLLALACAMKGAMAAVPDLTGTWRGIQICDELVGGRYENFVEQSSILIRQTGAQINLLYRGAAGSADNVLYEGVLQQVAGSTRAEGVAVACGGGYRSQEVLRLRPIQTSGSVTEFNADSQFFTDDFPGEVGIPDFGTCKFAYRRASTEPPTFSNTCTPPIDGR